LASDPEHPQFAPQWFNSDDQHAFVKLARENAHKTLELLRQQQPHLPAETQPAVNRVLQLEPAIAEHYERLTRTPVSVAKIRCHGDYHLGQVLVTEDDFVIIDFEGEPARSLTERQAKQLALRDVAGMVRSLHYASCAAAHAAVQLPGADRTNIHAVAQSWYAWCSTAFLAEYLRTVGRAPFVPENRTQLEEWFEGCLLQKAVYELRYELNNRPDWAYLPLAALLELVGAR
jgi:maltose alpha-D-glucosyltransferase / alpha-amylase